MRLLRRTLIPLVVGKLLLAVALAAAAEPVVGQPLPAWQPSS